METCLLFVNLVLLVLLIYMVSKLSAGTQSIPDEFGERLDRMISQVKKFIP